MGNRTTLPKRFRDPGSVIHHAVHSIKAEHIEVDTLDALSANVGTLTAGILRDTADRFRIDLDNALLTVADQTPTTRVQLGKVGAGATDYGLNIYDASGNLIVGISGLGNNVVGAAQVLTGAINTSKLAIGLMTGSALNDDPGFLDSTAWTIATTGSLVSITDGKVGHGAFRSSGSSQTVFADRLIPVDPNKVYRVRCWARSVGADGTFYAGLMLVDNSGNNITSGGGTYWYVAAGGVTPGGSFTEYVGTIGPSGSGATMTWPSNVYRMRPLFLPNFFSTTGYHEVQDFRIEEVLPGNLIVNGAITASHISVTTLSAISASLGTVTAGTIIGPLFKVQDSSGWGVQFLNSGGSSVIGMKSVPITGGQVIYIGTNSTATGLTDGLIVGSGSIGQVVRVTSGALFEVELRAVIGGLYDPLNDPTRDLLVKGDGNFEGFLEVEGSNGVLTNKVQPLTGTQLTLGDSGDLIVAGGSLWVVSNLEIDGALNHDGTTLGVFSVAPVSRQNVDNSGSDSATLSNLLQALQNYGLITTSV